jgi:hypothetical protein
MKSISIPPQFTGEGDRTTRKALERNDVKRNRHFALNFCFVAMFSRKTAHTFPHIALDAVVGALPIGKNRGQMNFSEPPSVCFATLAATSPGTPGE